MMAMSVTLLPGDCLDLLPTLAPASVDLILADLPYGTTACAWDSIIPLDRLWPEYKRVLKPRGAVVLTACQPFTSALVTSNPDWFRFDDVWDKCMPTDHLNVRKRPLRRHETVLVFSPATLGNFTYNPQMALRDKPCVKSCPTQTYGGDGVSPYGRYSSKSATYTHRYPTSIIRIANGHQRAKQHGTQKPLALMEYLIQTYSNPGDCVLDNTMGSGTTGVACLNTGRAFIGIERDPAYFAIAQARIEAAPC